MFSTKTTFVIYLLARTIWAGPIAKPDDVLPGQEQDFKNTIAEPLWGKEGPVHTDVKQGPDGECWFMAGLISLVKCNPLAITQLVQDTGIGNGEYGKATQKAKVKLYTNDSDWETFDVVYQSSIGGTADGLTTWWPAAMRRAALKMGGYYGLSHENEITGGYPNDALKMLTGKIVKYILDDTFDKNQIWIWIQHSDISPMILSTKDSAKKLVNGHAYVIMTYDGDGPENARLRLRNPWVGSEWYDLEKIYDEISRISALQEFQSVP
ncbi:uncharacterized protein I206_106692 [Kwoniella pini CBS 10737]|uniref:Calpain catalytic domain-containing protein n=1 Tax=Kwoniella pini CBS 10737 TaxID=1296096 RepID=A0A1B9HTG9_9TREE|nr:uncharacterized protein I206_07419 [Kwoniella pini CBS 10737]OCF46566.1 hypothetical protein I206_07419 [Kwoniella pini CBS 10737]